MRYFIIVLCLSFSHIMVFGQGTKRISDSGAYFNPDISVIVDTYYQQSSGSEGIAHILEEVSGFGHSHGDAGHEHGPLEGLNFREAEVYFSVNIDPSFYGYAIIAAFEEGAHIEEAVIQTTSLPYGLEVKAGKLFSNFGRLNSQHSHYWDFTDQPLIYRLTLGDHGLNDMGLAASYLAPTDFYLLGGIESFQGDNEQMSAYSGEDPLPERLGPRVLAGWLKVAPNLPSKHGLQFGASFGQGVHQEIHDGNSDGTDDHWLDGHNQFWGTDFVYKYDSMKAYGEGDWILQGEYFRKDGDLVVRRHDLVPALVSRHKKDQKDGYYLQAIYGIMPNWQAGLRWEQAGLVNSERLPDGTRNSFAPSNKSSLALTYRPSEFSYVRLQYSNGNYETSGGSENISQISLQLQISLGKHGAHKF
ncbi:MAG: TonB-dependent receptor [Planctomycetota bacterium]